jgi:hypothetical protein
VMIATEPSIFMIFFRNAKGVGTVSIGFFYTCRTMWWFLVGGREKLRGKKLVTLTVLIMK